MTNPDSEERSFDLLQWIPYCLAAEYDDDLALVGYYSKAQTERSNRALDAWDKEHPFKSSDELTAFQELERLGVYTNADFYSPSKAKDGHYTNRIKQLRDDSRKPEGSQGTFKQARTSRKHRPI